MIDRTAAEEHLRVIRSLMEKATVYRALSAPAALMGGLLSVGAAALLPWLERHRTDDPSRFFAIVWSVVFIITAASSLLLIQRDAARRGEPFLSHGARSAFQAMLPAMGLAAILTLAAFTTDSVPQCAPWWIGFYGLALLAMTHFAPRSISVLGWCFLISGAVAISGVLQRFYGSEAHPLDLPCAMLGSTFGLFHLVYAACTWPRGSSTK